jgi:ethanolamine ammonia-lyase small subunit
MNVTMKQRVLGLNSTTTGAAVILGAAGTQIRASTMVRLRYDDDDEEDEDASHSSITYRCVDGCWRV